MFDTYCIPMTPEGYEDKRKSYSQEEIRNFIDRAKALIDLHPDTSALELKRSAIYYLTVDIGIPLSSIAKATNIDRGTAYWHRNQSTRFKKLGDQQFLHHYSLVRNIAI